MRIPTRSSTYLSFVYETAWGRLLVSTTGTGQCMNTVWLLYVILYFLNILFYLNESYLVLSYGCQPVGVQIRHIQNQHWIEMSVFLWFNRYTCCSFLEIHFWLLQNSLIRHQQKNLEPHPCWICALQIILIKVSPAWSTFKQKHLKQAHGKIPSGHHDTYPFCFKNEIFTCYKTNCELHQEHNHLNTMALI